MQGRWVQFLFRHQQSFTFAPYNDTCWENLLSIDVAGLVLCPGFELGLDWLSASNTYYFTIILQLMFRFSWWIVISWKIGNNYSLEQICIGLIR